jgi:molybdenum cofactor cytidylyltransferase
VVSEPRFSIGALVLAAGGSRRLGFPKQLLTFRGSPLVARAAGAALDAGARPVIVVLGADSDLTVPVLMGIDGITTVINEGWRSGVASSLTAGIAALLEHGELDGFLVTLVDQPKIGAAALQRLIDAFDDGHRIVASSYAETIGVPAIFGKEFADELLKLTGDTGAKQFLLERADDVTLVEMPEAEMDIDTVNDIDGMREADTTEWPKT